MKMIKAVQSYLSNVRFSRCLNIVSMDIFAIFSLNIKDTFLKKICKLMQVGVTST